MVIVVTLSVTILALAALVVFVRRYRDLKWENAHLHYSLTVYRGRLKTALDNNYRLALTNQRLNHRIDLLVYTEEP